jgi:hypothetical protein
MYPTLLSLTVPYSVARCSSTRLIHASVFYSLSYLNYLKGEYIIIMDNDMYHSTIIKSLIQGLIKKDIQEWLQ